MDEIDPALSNEGAGDESETSPISPQSARKNGKKEFDREKSEREKRTYRACLHCRQRKSRCDLYSSGEPGRPPCERCIREQHECILGGSRRGGRRVKRTQSDVPGSATQGQSTDNLVRPVPLPPTLQSYQSSTQNGQALPPWIDRESRVLPPIPQEPPVHTSTPTAKMTVDDTVAATDLQNPADALEFLANVAERDSGSNQLAPMQGYGRSHRPSLTTGALHEANRMNDQSSNENGVNYAPLAKGQVGWDMIQILLNRYSERYHQYFPIANPAAMEFQNLRTSAAKEPHLLAAILTVASRDEKDWWHVHEACSAHMQQLMADLVYSGRGSVEAVEAMLILAEWVPRRPHSTPAVGRGEEDQAAWMFVGTAIRLGYLLGIDRTGFRTDGESQSAELNRKRLAWAACYMSDRQISVRLGKAFWSRGPGPMTGLRAQDFPSLQQRPNRYDDLAAIFEANLELTQLFSNAHDVLYATKARSSQLNFGGEYVKYIDDFRVALRSWHRTWGSFTCSAPLKASLVLSYEYLRLYINAFAYQATLNRIVAHAQATASGEQPQVSAYPFGADVAATPDARFIYDSIDAAKSLLSTFNSFVDPSETFRYMPLRYYLYVIYSACFLYKARATGVMGGDTRGSIKKMITDTVDRLQQASAYANDVGDRYSRLIRLLWRKSPGRASIAEGMEITRPTTAQAGPTSAPEADQNLNETNDVNTFSWLDLGAIGDFALTNNESVSGSMDSWDHFDETPSEGFPPFDQNLLMQQYNWNTMSPSGVIF